MSPEYRDIAGIGGSFPRVSGDEPARKTRFSESTKCSPRERG